MKKSNFLKPIFFLLLLGLGACKIDNLDRGTKTPKSNFTTFNYVMSTEDASDVDITTFFSFNLQDIDPQEEYDPVDRGDIFINSNPSTSSGHISFNQFVFSMAKDKKGYSSAPGLYRLTLDEDNHMFIDNELNISRDNLFPARQLTLVNDHLGYFYDEGKESYKIQIFDPTQMILKGAIDLKPIIEKFNPNTLWVDAENNNMVRTGSLVLENNQGRLYVSIVFLEKAGFNLIADSTNHFYLAVVDINSNTVEKIISYEDAQTVGFFVSENKASCKDESGNLFFDSWGWNQFNEHKPSKIFRIKSGESDFDKDWEINVDQIFGVKRIAQSMIAYNHKIYLHISDTPYPFSDDSPEAVKMHYYEFDIDHPQNYKLLDIPASNPSSRMNVFNIIDDKLFIAVPNAQKGNFNGFYSIDRNGDLKQEIQISNKYRPTRLYKFHN
ncbi:MAG: hypothetical protein M9887_08105 [Chitinophagales bacterium]|nr:hypothetical protein [Chitinophagales bacterium]